MVFIFLIVSASVHCCRIVCFSINNIIIIIVLILNKHKNKQKMNYKLSKYIFIIITIIFKLIITGHNCEENLDECLSNPCQNGGTCHDKDNGYICNCSPGYLGLYCEHDVAVCNTGNSTIIVSFLLLLLFSLFWLPFIYVSL